MVFNEGLLNRGLDLELKGEVEFFLILSKVVYEVERLERVLE